MDRRQFLESSAAFLVYFSLGSPASAGLQGSPAGKPLEAGQVDSLLAIHPDGRVTIYTSKVDVGTGVRIAIAQMAAEELGIPVDRVTVIDGDTSLCPDQGGTGGSTGLTRGGTEIRQAAATARREMEARGTTMASLAGRPLALAVDPKAQLRSPAQFTAIGKPALRPDVPAKCTGRRVYVQDVKAPNMVHARVIRPPSIGATLEAVDDTSIRQVPGVRVVRLKNFLAVVSKDEWNAVRAARELKATWTENATLPGSDVLDSWSRQAAVDRDQSIVAKGDAAAAIASAPHRRRATYFWPYQSHASLGPSCAVADIQGDGGTVWSASQAPHGLRQNLARVFGLNAEKLRVIFTDGSGSYGTNGGDHAAADAVLLSKTLAQPVRVQWTRQDETGWSPKGPHQLIEIQVGFDDSGRILGWDTEMWLSTNVPGARALHAADAAGLAQEHGQAAGLVTQNGDPPYAADTTTVRVHWLKETPLQLSNLRAPGKIANVFAVESVTDELAVAVGADPVAYRLAGLKDPRAIEVINRAAQTFGWQPRASSARGERRVAPSGSDVLVGRGFSYMRYKQAENYVAMAMEVAVAPSSGRITVRRVVCAHDCGLIVNPDGLTNQIEGCILQTISRTVHEEVTFDRFRVTSVDWATYPILRFPDAPKVEVVLVDRPDQPIMGAGEAATAPVAAAIANAVFDATGVRLRTVPFTPARVKAALATVPAAG